jgi:5-methylcytosine-specific restriction endonuclease McrA
MNELYGAKTWSVDHIQPLSKGGSHRLSNLQILPFMENVRKHAHV